MKLSAIAAAVLLSIAASGAGAADTGTGVLTYHNDPARSGLYIAPKLTEVRAAHVALDPDFNASFTGNVYAQPLYWLPPGAKNGIIVVATESNDVYALDAKTGAQVWHINLGAETPKSALCAGNIDPVGVTGAPVIDPDTATLYLDASIQGDSGPSHKVFALALDGGAIRQGWPLDVAQGLAPLHQTFDSTAQGQRGALAFVGGKLFVPFAGISGDCGNYRGMAVGIRTKSNPAITHAWVTRIRGGGVWGQGGIAFDGESMFMTTGNTFTSPSTPWGDGEAVIRLALSLAHSSAKADFFVPSNWQALDAGDTDLGGTGPLPFDIPQGGHKLQRIMQFGKDGKAYLLDRGRLGGLGGQLAVTTISTTRIKTGPTAFPAPGATFIVLEGYGAHCPNGQSGDVVGLRISANHPTTIETRWCRLLAAQTAPIVTTTDGKSEPIVWIVGAENDNELHAYRGTDGEPLYTSGAMAGLHHFQTLIAAQNRLYVAADGKVYAFKY